MAIAANVDRALLLRRRALKQAQGRRRLTLLCAAVLTLFAPAGYWALANSSVFKVSSVAVQGGGSLLDAEVQQAALGAIGHRSLLQVDAGAVERAVERLPYVRSATVDRAFPHTLAVRIDAYHAAALVRSGGRRYLVAQDGRVLEQAPGQTALPAITMPAGLVLRPGERATAAGVSAGLAVLGAVTPAFTSGVGHVRRIAAGPTAVVVVVGRGFQVRLGAPTDVALKLRVATRVLRTMVSTTRSALAYVDVSVPARPALGYKHSTST